MCSFGDDDNPYDIKCPRCDKHFCSLCRCNTHFPATCSERARWTSRGLPRDIKQVRWYEWCDNEFGYVADEISMIKSWKNNFEAAVLNAHSCIGFAIDEMERMLQTYRWVCALICCYLHLWHTFGGHLAELLDGYRSVKSFFPNHSSQPESWRLVDLNAARTTTANVVSHILSNLLSAKQGGSYSVGVLVTQPADRFCVGISDVVDETLVPALRVSPEYLLKDGVVVDASVDWAAIMRRTITLWSTFPSRS